MIQLRSALEDLARVRCDPRVQLPSWQLDPAIRDQLDGPLLQQVVERAGVDNYKVLLVGATWPRLATELAGRGAFVSVIDADKAAIRAVSDAAAAGGYLGKITVYDDDYKDRAFSPSAFNSIICWDVLNRYNERVPLFKKMSRELKAGGNFIVRAAAAARPPQPGELSFGLRRMVRLALSVRAGTDGEVTANDAFLMPGQWSLDPEELHEHIAELFVVQEMRRHHAVVADLADLAAHAAPTLRPLLPLALLADDALIARRPDLGRFLLVTATKEKQLGSIFKIGG